MTPLLSCTDLTIGHDGRPVAAGISFQVHQGDHLCIVGENGCGKSTLIKTLLHLIPALSGCLETAPTLSPQEIGYLPQQTTLQRDFPASVREVVLSGCLNRCGWRPFYNREERRLADRNMERMGILHLARSCYRTLSGGQQQRVLLARALCSAGRLLLLDEPVAGLDPTATADLYTLVNCLHQEDGLTIIMVTHDIGAALRAATHILHLGRHPLFCGTKEAYLASGLPQTFMRLEEQP